MFSEYEKDFSVASRMRVADATEDPRFMAGAPGVAYTKQQHDTQESKETQWNKISNTWGIGSSYVQPEIFRVG
jgi:hypothetical protein